MLVFGVLLLLGTLALAFSDIRWGVTLILIAGIVQDPIRKSTDAQSPLWVGLVVVYFAPTLAGAFGHKFPFFWRRPDWKKVRNAATIFGIVLGVQAVFTLARLGIPQVVAIGLAAYLGPPAALILGVWAGQSPARVRAGMWLYVALVLCSASGIVLTQLGMTGPLLDTVGIPLIVYDLERGAVELPAGFFRTPEVASWHCATACCAVLVLATSARMRAWRYAFLGTAAAFLVWATLMGGRRKGIGEVVVFVAVYALLLVWMRGRLGRFGGAVLGGVLVASLIMQRINVEEQVAGSLGSMRSRSTGESGWTGRLVQNIRDLPAVVSYNGFLGRGLGTLTQGGSYYGTGEDWGFANEGGFSRIVGELGAPGAAVFLFVTLRFVANVRKKLPAIRSLPSSVSTQVLGILAILGANVVVFVSAHQIFGDPFVYLLLGLLAGAVVASVDEAAITIRAVAAGRTTEDRPLSLAVA